MIRLYVDNFRGFKNTLIPLKKVNFLVGENSTGKTSILSLLNLLSSPQFWREYEFNTDQVDLGSFKNIVSMESKDRSCFRIGFHSFQEGEEGGLSVILMLMTFTEKSDLPFLSRVNYIENDFECELLFSEESIKYRGRKVDFVDHSPDPEFDFYPGGALEIIKNWEDNAFGEAKFETLIEYSGFGKSLFLPSLDTQLTEVKSKIFNKKSDEYQILPVSWEFYEPFTWIAPIRSKPRRTYDQYKINFSPEGAHSPYLIKKLLTDEKTRNPFLKFIEGFGNESNLLNAIEINPFGNDPSSPFELKVKLDGKLLGIDYVGYGVSQCLPLLVEMFSRDNGAWYAIQQPEVHLHPKAQAALGGLIYNLAISEEKGFFIETHSDYIIDRFRLNLRLHHNKKTVDSQVLYFERTPEGNAVYPIDIEESGNYSENQPETFRNFFVKEQLDLLSLD